MAAAVPYANLNNPQTLNLYAMASDDPETFADLDGHIITPGYQEMTAEEGNAQGEQQTQATPEAETKRAPNKSWWQKALGYFYWKVSKVRGLK